MAEPAFIYAFDNLGPSRFTELCGVLLGSRYTGFLLGGEGPDGGIDAEIDNDLGVLHPEVRSPLLEDIIQPKETVIFQFKHKVTARVGQSEARTQLLTLYRCNPKTGKVCELHRKLVKDKQPTTYILVTNVEVNAPFRTTFIQQCKTEEPAIRHYQVIGLDELVAWIKMMPELRHWYFPTIFGSPRFDLRIKVSLSTPFNYAEGRLETDERLGTLLSVSVLNVGTVPAYLDAHALQFQFNIDGRLETHSLLGIVDEVAKNINLQPAIVLEPGRRFTYNYPLTYFSDFRKQGKDIFPIEILVHDEIGNIYRGEISDDVREAILKGIYKGES